MRNLLVVMVIIIATLVFTSGNVVATEEFEYSIGSIAEEIAPTTATDVITFMFSNIIIIVLGIVLFSLITAYLLVCKKEQNVLPIAVAVFLSVVVILLKTKGTV